MSQCFPLMKTEKILPPYVTLMDLTCVCKAETRWSESQQEDIANQQKFSPSCRLCFPSACQLERDGRIGRIAAARVHFLRGRGNARVARLRAHMHARTCVGVMKCSVCTRVRSREIMGRVHQRTEHRPPLSGRRHT